jgi:hypothetical protein
MRSDLAAKTRHSHYDRLYVRLVPEVTEVANAQYAAEQALRYAQLNMPRLSGRSANRLQPVWDVHYFGVRWLDNYVWFQEMGIRPFVMNNLQGKTIPMWVEDRTGDLARQNPKAKTRRTADGRNQILIFRHAAKRGQRKTVQRKVRGRLVTVSVPRSYPGAPGRIARRHPGAPISRKPHGGKIAASNGGVRWRYPGLDGRFMIHQALLITARSMGFTIGPVEAAEQSEEIVR